MKTITSKFDGRCAACGSVIKAGTTVRWKAGYGVRHETSLQCDAAKAAAVVAAPAPVAAVPAVEVQGAGIVAFLLGAQSRGLKFPAVRFLAPGGGELKLSVSGATSRVPGSVQVKVDGAWVGRIEPSGACVGRGLVENAALIATLERIAVEPAVVAAEYGKLTGCCSFCDRALEDAGSVEVGYGPICAKRYGLPHSPKGVPALAAA